MQKQMMDRKEAEDAKNSGPPISAKATQVLTKQGCIPVPMPSFRAGTDNEFAATKHQVTPSSTVIYSPADSNPSDCSVLKESQKTMPEHIPCWNMIAPW